MKFLNFGLLLLIAIAIRSGNWALRNSAIQALTPLFFAYNHYKYEELAVTVLLDSLTLPGDMLSMLKENGQLV